MAIMSKVSVCVLVALAPAVARGVDLTVASLEVTQGIQNPANSIELVAHRSTAVRARIVDLDGGAVSGVTGSLTVSDGATFITPLGGLSATNEPFSVPVGAVDRENETHTLNFAMRDPWIVQLVPSTGVTFRVDVDVAGDGDTTNNFLAVTLPIRDIVNPRVFFQRIEYPPFTLGPPDLMRVKRRIGDAMFAGVFPVKETDPFLYAGIPTILTFSTDTCLALKIDKDIGTLDSMSCAYLSTGCASPGTLSDVDALFQDLGASLQLVVNTGFGFSSTSFLYGWLPTNRGTHDIFPCRGWASPSDHVAFGNTELERYQRTFAHEMGHLFGLCHVDRMLDEVGWDVGSRLKLNPVGNRIPECLATIPGSTGAVERLSRYDFMKPKKLTCEAWVDTIHYGKILSDGFFGTGSSTAMPDAEIDTEILYVQGAFSTDGSTLTHLPPAFRFPWLSQATSEEAAGPYLVEVTDENGIVTTRQFDARLGGPDGADDAEDAAVINGHFGVRVPVEPGVRATLLRILSSADPAVVFRTIEGTINPPGITVLSPLEGEFVTGDFTIEWLVDTDPDDLPPVSHIAYSIDDGDNFMPLAVNETDGSVTIDAERLPAANGTGLIRIISSDGLNTSFEDIGGLTVDGGLFLAATSNFIRGDASPGGVLDISDALTILNYLFRGSPASLDCEKAADFDDCGNIDIADPIGIIYYLFRGGPSPRPPFPTCGPDPSSDSLTCVTSPPC